MVVKYVEDFVGLDGQIYESKVVSDCGSIRLVPDCGGLISAVFLYRDNEQNMIIPFSGIDLSQKIVYLDNILDIHVASGIIDLSGFKAVKMSRYIELNTFAKTMVKSPLFENVPIDARNVKRDISQKMVYLYNNILDIHISSGIIDLSGFKAVKMSKYIELNTVMKTIGKSPLLEEMANMPMDARSVIKDICHAVEFNDDSFEHLFETMKEEL